MGSKHTTYVQGLLQLAAQVPATDTTVGEALIWVQVSKIYIMNMR